MRPEEVYRILDRRPFQPVRIHVVDGRCFDITSRQLAVVGLTWLDIGIPAPGESEPIYDYVVTLPLKDISRIEPLGATAPPVPG